MLQLDTVGIVRSVLTQSLAELRGFLCPSHHREQYDRTEAALHYLLLPGNLERVVLVEHPTFAPVCADLVPDSGVSFLRCARQGPRDLASAMEQGRLSDTGLFQHLWDDALGVEFPQWREVADRAPVIFVRIGMSEQTDGRWHWAPLDGPHTAVQYPDVRSAFEALLREAQQQGDAALVGRLELWRHGLLEAVS